MLEDANIKLGTVATDVLGVSGRDMLEAIVSGQEDPEVLAELVRCRLRAKEKKRCQEPFFPPASVFLKGS